MRALLALLVLLWAGPVGAQSFVYVANPTSSDISGYAVHPQTGELTPLAGFPMGAGTQPRGVALHPSGRFLYHALQSAGTVSAFKVAATTGALTAIGGPVSTGGTAPLKIALDPAGVFAYVVNLSSSSVSAFRVHATTGALTAVSGSPFATGGTSVIAAAVDPSGRFLYVVNQLSNSLTGFAINRASGALLPVPGSPFTTDDLPQGVVVHSSGAFVYVTNRTSNTLSGFSMDAGTGVLAPLAGSPFPGQGSPAGAALHPSGRFLYVTNVTHSTVSGFEINASTGALTPIAGSPFPAGFFANEVAVDVSGRFAFVTTRDSGTVQAYTIDGSTGALTVAGGPAAAGTQPLELTTGRNFTRGDFDANGLTDLLWRHETSGQNVVWHMNGSALASGTFTTPSALVDANWRMVGTHDFNLDRGTDILWRHDVAGQNVVWFMNGTSLASGTFLTPAALADINWKMAGTGDFNQDGKPDIAWHHRLSGQVVLWYMNGSVLVSGTFTTPSAFPDTSWRIAGVADFNEDHKPDVLWRNAVSGQMLVWSMDGATQTSVTPTSPSGLADPNWEIVALGDYDSDAKPDLVWRHALSGQNAIWYMNGVTLAGGTLTTPSTLPDANWRIVGPR